MELIGTIKKVLPMESGTSKAGNEYKRVTVIIEYGDRYPKELALTLMNEKCDTFAPALQCGMRLKFLFDPSSREYNGRYYTECIVWKIDALQAQQAMPIPSQQFPQVPPSANGVANDLPW